VDQARVYDPAAWFFCALFSAQEASRDWEVIILSYENMHNEDHLTDVGNQEASDERTARPDDLSSVHTSLEGVEEEATFAESVNGLCSTLLSDPAICY